MVLGFTLLYFVNAAFKVDIWETELLIHSGIRFFAGFIAIGVWVFSQHRIKFLHLFYFVLALVLADDIWDYFRNINSFKPEAMVLPQNSSGMRSGLPVLTASRIKL